MADVDCPSFTLVIIGDGRTGKTTFVNRHLTGEFESRHEPTVGLQIEPLYFFTNRGRIRFYCWDTAPKKSRGGLNGEFYTKVHCAIVMFNVTTRLSYWNVPTWLDDLWWACEDVPIVVCGNKVDRKNRKVKAEQVSFQRNNRNLQYYDISVKRNYNLEEPFLYLARKLTGDANLHFVESPALDPPPQVQLQINDDELLNEAANKPLPDDDVDEAFDLLA